MRRLVLSCVCVVALLAACGGETAEEVPSPDPVTEDVAPTTTETETETDQDSAVAVETDSGGDSATGTFEGTITVDGTSTRVSFDQVDWSLLNNPISVSGTCSPDFFGSGRWFAIGFAVDDDNVAVPYNGGDDVGTVQFDLPPDTWEEELRDPPEMTVEFGDDEYRIATPEEAVDGPMAWTIGETTMAGTATMVDWEGNTHIVEFDVECSGERANAIDLDDLPDVDEDDAPVSAAAMGVGTFSDGDTTHSNVTVGRCLPFDDSDPRNLSVYAMTDDASTFLEITVNYNQAFVPPGSDAAPEEIHAYAFLSRDSLSFQFERRVDSNDGATWYETLPYYDQSATPLEDTSLTITDSRVTGQVKDLEQSWPDAGGELASVTFDLEIPAETAEC